MERSGYEFKKLFTFREKVMQFIDGASEIFNIFGSIPPLPNSHLTDDEYVRTELERDWREVGDDLRWAMHKADKEITQSPKKAA